ncbi:AraC family transcriptional regulator [Kiloniella sp. EL199]|uniref:AraC family transcriptional regulator n=1 Tax=Kiloniella sp. EL199 TaxID=2107581 RepID=UPI000EA1A062|nr:AraC family transcriptional regulator [Kiloniella sp. EL199]
MPINKAISFIEQNLGHPITLGEIAERSGLSPYYFARLFRSATGKTVMGYLRHRRLTEAAKILESGQNASLIHLALDYGFDSQEAFTRAFKKCFGFPPGQYRANGCSMGHKYQLPLRHPIIPDPGVLPMEPNIVKKEAFNVIGMSDDFGQDNNKSVVDLWKAVGCRYPEIDHSNNGRAYGLCLKGSPESFTYMASFEVDNLSTIPSGMEGLAVDAAEYAVFTFTVNDKSPIGDQFSKVYQGIWGNWLPNSDYEYADTPDFELYDDRFDGSSATGEVDIWIPVTKKALST